MKTVWVWGYSDNTLAQNAIAAHATGEVTVLSAEEPESPVARVSLECRIGRRDRRSGFGGLRLTLDKDTGERSAWR